MAKFIHPFPARMASELAFEALQGLTSESLVVDPMMGSGTTIRQAAELGHHAIGYDMDPLAVLMTKVWTRPVDQNAVRESWSKALDRIHGCANDDVILPWIDHDNETQKFISYWFAQSQVEDLRKVAFVLNELGQGDEIDVLRIALSRIIVTRNLGASLARDAAHSRPHRVMTENDYQVIPGITKSIEYVLSKLDSEKGYISPSVARGDARYMPNIGDSTVDAVITSPPYLNAIDYLRGHKLSLVWLGYSISSLRNTKSNSIGSERAPDPGMLHDFHSTVRFSMGDVARMDSRHQSMIDRYVVDIIDMVGEISRILRSHASATFVMGNSCLRGVFVKNSEAVRVAAILHGMEHKNTVERPLLNHMRNMPVMKDGALSKRMRTETIMTFIKV